MSAVIVVSPEEAYDGIASAPRVRESLVRVADGPRP
jgi:hypothetical protein